MTVVKASLSHAMGHRTLRQLLGISTSYFCRWKTDVFRKAKSCSHCHTAQIYLHLLTDLIKKNLVTPHVHNSPPAAKGVNSGCLRSSELSFRVRSLDVCSLLEGLTIGSEGSSSFVPTMMSYVLGQVALVHYYVTSHLFHVIQRMIYDKHPSSFKWV